MRGRSNWLPCLRATHASLPLSHGHPSESRKRNTHGQHCPTHTSGCEAAAPRAPGAASTSTTPVNPTVIPPTTPLIPLTALPAAPLPPGVYPPTRTVAMDTKGDYCCWSTTQVPQGHCMGSSHCTMVGRAADEENQASAMVKALWRMVARRIVRHRKDRASFVGNRTIRVPGERLLWVLLQLPFVLMIHRTTLPIPSHKHEPTPSTTPATDNSCCRAFSVQA